MNYIKYIALLFPFVLILIDKFAKKNKNEQSDFQKSAGWGKFFIILSIISFIVGIFVTFQDEEASKRKEASSEVRRDSDSILLSKRWEYDTSRIRQLLDSSKVIISNSLMSIDKSTSNLRISDSLMKVAKLQASAIDHNIQMTSKLNYPLPYSIPINFRITYKLDRKVDSLMIIYLDSLVSVKRDSSNKILDFFEYFSLEYKELNDKRVNVLKSMVNFFLTSTMDFVINKEPILRLNCVPSHNYNDQLSITYFKGSNQVDIQTKSGYFFETGQQRKVGVTSLIDLEGAVFFLYSTFFGISKFESNRLQLSIKLGIGQRYITLEDLVCLKQTDLNNQLSENPDLNSLLGAKKNNDKYLNEMTTFFVDGITQEMLTGTYKSLKTKIISDTERARIHMIMISYMLKKE